MGLFLTLNNCIKTNSLSQGLSLRGVLARTRPVEYNNQIIFTSDSNFKPNFSNTEVIICSAKFLISPPVAPP